MDRIDLAARAAHTPPRIALLDALGLKALVVPVREQSAFETRDHVDFIALGADRRLRWGSFRIIADGPLPRVAPKLLSVGARRPPEGPDDLARAIAEAVDMGETGGFTASSFWRNPPFTLSGWSPATRAGCLQGRPDLGMRRELPGFEWLGGEPFDDATANRLWDESLAPFVTPEDIEAAPLFEVGDGIDFAAFDAARAVGGAGALRRAFARDNPLLANVVLRDAALRALVDGGGRLRDILDAMADGPKVDIWPPNAAGRRTASKRALLNVSGRALVPDGPMLSQDDALSAAEELPIDWLPLSRAEAVAFTALCGLARHVFGRMPRPAGDGMWRQALAGAAGRWVAYADRVVEARGGVDRTSVARRLGWMQAEDSLITHFARDVLVPVAMAYGDGTATALARHRLPSDGWLKETNAFSSFARDAFLAGMALPAYADAVRRQAELRPAIRAVVAAHPRTGPRGRNFHQPFSRPEILALPDGRRLLANLAVVGTEPPPVSNPNDPRLPPTAHAVFGADDPDTAWTLVYGADDRSPPPPWPEVEAATMARWGSPEALLHAATEGAGLPTLRLPPLVRRHQADHDVGAPGAIEAMLDAWRRALPRRWRKLDARALAAAFDAEAAAYAEARGIDLGASRAIPAV